ncbi:hypothetical protein GCM10020258_17760 [Sphingomonas yabuuchiae]
MKLSRAQSVAAAHNDPAAFEDAIRAWRTQGGKGTAWIAVESLYSMDGDTAPLAELMAVAERHDAMLIVDEAHATGVFGERGQGLATPGERVVTLHTCGKALGCEGALVAGPAIVRDYLVNRGRGFIFSTAPSPSWRAGCARPCASSPTSPNGGPHSTSGSRWRESVWRNRARWRTARLSCR